MDAGPKSKVRWMVRRTDQRDVATRYGLPNSAAEWSGWGASGQLEVLVRQRLVVVSLVRRAQQRVPLADRPCLSSWQQWRLGGCHFLLLAIFGEPSLHLHFQPLIAKVQSQVAPHR